MTAHVIAPNPVSPFDAALRVLNTVLAWHEARLVVALADARLAAAGLPAGDPLGAKLARAQQPLPLPQTGGGA